ncbi:hypothetical protein J6590_013224 [Homalodisca vitripennis]|nr:hypothetical protein J6590_013224 [Homalodisca vitripennis]
MRNGRLYKKAIAQPHRPALWEVTRSNEEFLSTQFTAVLLNVYSGRAGTCSQSMLVSKDSVQTTYSRRDRDIQQHVTVFTFLAHLSRASMRSVKPLPPVSDQTPTSVYLYKRSVSKELSICNNILHRTQRCRLSHAVFQVPQSADRRTTRVLPIIADGSARECRVFHNEPEHRCTVHMHRNACTMHPRRTMHPNTRAAPAHRFCACLVN